MSEKLPAENVTEEVIENNEAPKKKNPLFEFANDHNNKVSDLTDELNTPIKNDDFQEFQGTGTPEEDIDPEIEIEEDPTENNEPTSIDDDFGQSFFDIQDIFIKSAAFWMLKKNSKRLNLSPDQEKKFVKAWNKIGKLYQLKPISPWWDLGAAFTGIYGPILLMERKEFIDSINSQKGNKERPVEPSKRPENIENFEFDPTTGEYYRANNIDDLLSMIANLEIPTKQGRPDKTTQELKSRVNAIKEKAKSI